LHGHISLDVSACRSAACIACLSELLFVFQKETPSDQQLHLAALQGNVEQIRKVLEGGKVHVDCKDKVTTTCVFFSRLKLLFRKHQFDPLLNYQLNFDFL